MSKEKALAKLAREIVGCSLCKKGGFGKAVPGEGNANARIVFIGEAPGKEEAKIGRPFVGRSGKFLREKMKEIGLTETDIFITSPGHYLPHHRTPSVKTIFHGRTHLFKQIEIIDPEIIVLLGNTACIAMLDNKVEISRQHGKIIKKNGRMHLITFHPAYAMRFPEGKKHFLMDFQILKKFLSNSALKNKATC
jgi:uracil-DNA glycosylase family 4